MLLVYTNVIIISAQGSEIIILVIGIGSINTQFCTKLFKYYKNCELLTFSEFLRCDIFPYNTTAVNKLQCSVQCAVSIKWMEQTFGCFSAEIKAV